MSRHAESCPEMQCFLKPVQAESGSLGAFGFPESGVRECHFVQKDHVFENQRRPRLGHWEHSGFQNLPRWPFLLFDLQKRSLFVNPLSGLLFVLTALCSQARRRRLDHDPSHDAQHRCSTASSLIAACRSFRDGRWGGRESLKPA